MPPVKYINLFGNDALRFTHKIQGVFFYYDGIDKEEKQKVDSDAIMIKVDWAFKEQERKKTNFLKKL